MTESTTRRTYLLAVLRNLNGPVTTKLALDIYATSPWRTASRGTARRDLRDLARRGYLILDWMPGPRTYTLAKDPEPVHPIRARGGARPHLLEAIRAEGGEWTVGRVKRACRQIVGTHVYRSTARRHLFALHRDGHLERHGDGTPRRFYTSSTKGGTA